MNPPKPPPKPHIQFPTVFPLRVIGANTDEFAQVVRAVLDRHAPGLGEEAYSHRPSGAGKYLAITVTFTPHSRAQLDDIYRELNAHELVLWTL